VGVAAIAAGVGCHNRPRCEPGSAVEQAFERELVTLVNETRRAGAVCGGQRLNPVSPVSRSAALDCAARGHSTDMATRGFFDHLDPDGRLAVERAERAGYRDRRVSENLAWGQQRPRQVVEIWLGSPDHCRAMMAPEHRTTGVGFATGAAGKPFWTQLFGAS
jgi:uncharacterized protein YkwD